MAWTTPRTWVTNETVTAAIMNQAIRDNLSALWTGTTANDMEYYSSSTGKTRLAIGTTNQILGITSGHPAWVSRTPVTTTGDIIYSSGTTTEARLGIGSTAQQLTVVGGLPTWRTNQVFLESSLQNTSYDGDAVSIGLYTYNAHTFHASIPTTARALMVSISVRWAAASSSTVAILRPAGSSGNGLMVRSQVANFYQDANGIVPLNSSGQFEIEVSNAAASNFFIDIWGYFL